MGVAGSTVTPCCPSSKSDEEFVETHANPAAEEETIPPAESPDEAEMLIKLRLLEAAMLFQDKAAH